MLERCCGSAVAPDGRCSCVAASVTQVWLPTASAKHERLDVGMVGVTNTVVNYVFIILLYLFSSFFLTV